jgi:hypothetical protein
VYIKNLITFIFFVSCCLRTLAQQLPTDTSLKTLTKIDIGFQGIGLSYEPRITNKITIDLAAGIGGGNYVSEDRADYRWSLLEPAFYFIINPKFYYNRQRRLKKGKTLLNNAGNYLGARIKYATGNHSTNRNYVTYPALLFNVHWGIQRPLGERWLLNAHAGLGYAIDINSGFANVLYPAIDVKFAYVLGKAKR